MTARDMPPRSGEDPANPPRKRPYVAPKLERLGTIRQLALGPGANDNFDGGHPPGQNKSRV